MRFISFLNQWNNFLSHPKQKKIKIKNVYQLKLYLFSSVNVSIWKAQMSYVEKLIKDSMIRYLFIILFLHYEPKFGKKSIFMRQCSVFWNFLSRKPRGLWGNRATTYIKCVSKMEYFPHFSSLCSDFYSILNIATYLT